MNTISVTGRALLTLPVARIDKSEKWYAKVLDFRTERKLDDPPWCEMAHGNGAIRIGLAEVQDVKLGHTALTLMVADLAQEVEKLRALSVQCSAVTEVPGLAKLVNFEDPDGHRLMLRQDLR